MEARRPELSVSTDIFAPIDKSMPKGIYKCREFGKKATEVLNQVEKVYKVYVDIYLWLL